MTQLHHLDEEAYKREKVERAGKMDELLKTANDLRDMINIYGMAEGIVRWLDKRGKL